MPKPITVTRVGEHADQAGLSLVLTLRARNAEHCTQTMWTKTGDRVAPKHSRRRKSGCHVGSLEKGLSKVK